MGERADIEVNMNGNKSGFSRTLSDCRKEISDFAKETGEDVAESWSPKTLAAGALSYMGFEAVKDAFQGFLDRASEIRSVSEELGLSADETQRWGQAAREAGFEMNQIANTLSTIADKRAQAQNDMHLRGVFTQLGVPEADIFNENVGLTQFVREMGTKGSDRDVRRLLYELVGPKGYRVLTGSSEGYEEQKAELPPEAIKEAQQMKEAEEAIERKVQNVIGKAALGAYRVGQGTVWQQFKADWKSRGWKAIEDPLGIFFKKNVGHFSPAEKLKKPEMLGPGYSDYLAQKEAADQKEAYYNLEEEKHHERMIPLLEAQKEAERSIMTVGMRRMEIVKDIKGLQEQIKDIEEDVAFGGTYASQELLAKLRTREAQLKHDLMLRPSAWMTQAAAHMAGIARGSTTFGPEHGDVAKTLKDIHMTIIRNGIF